MERFELAREAMLRAGEALCQCYVKQDEVTRKSGHQDLVTYWDQKTEQFLREKILSAFPQDSIVGEEYPPEKKGENAVTWYLDPIDGTTNFINQHKNYAISAGCWEGDKPLFGLVLDVERRQLYWAKHGEGAWRNQKKIYVSQRREISEMLFLTPGIQQTFLEEHSWQDGLVSLAKDVRAVRSYGSVALELCAVAAGEAELCAAVRSCPWDHNGARIILQEAGGDIFTLDGRPLPLNEKTTVLAVNSVALKQEIVTAYYKHSQK